MPTTFPALPTIGTSDLRDIVHEIVVSPCRARAGDFVIPGIELCEADDVLSDPRSSPAAGAILVPMNGHPVARYEAAPICLRHQIEEGVTARLHSFARQQIHV